MELLRSARRRRTASAGVRDGRLVVRVPAHASRQEEQRLVATLVRRLRRRATSPPPPIPGLPDRVERRDLDGPRVARGDGWLVARADDVGDRWLDGVRASHVSWSTRMSTRWASCTVATRRIRVSDRLADAPLVVVDHILLHELAHLLVRGHGPTFTALLARDPAAALVDRWLDRRSALETASALRRAGLLDDGDAVSAEAG